MDFRVEGTSLQGSIYLIEVMFQSAGNRMDHNSQWRVQWVLQGMRDLFRQMNNPTGGRVQLRLVQADVNCPLQNMDDLVFVVMDM